MRPEIRWECSAGALLLLAVVYFFDDAGTLAALFPAALAHELGHCAALYGCGGYLTAVRVGVFGVEMEYDGLTSRRERLLSLLAGPAAGLLYGLAVRAIGGEFFSRSGGFSLCLTAFNLLPVRPLDGGSVVAELLPPDRASRISRTAARLFALGGLILLLRTGILWPLILGLWLLFKKM